MSRKVVNCPFCGRFLPEEIWKEKSQTIQEKEGGSRLDPQRVSVHHEGIKCYRCGGEKVWKDAHLKTRSGTVQRYYCRDCGSRFTPR